jgi:hypothetical protein
LDKVSYRLFKNRNMNGVSISALIDTLKDSDKDLFIKYRDSQITFDQLKCRIAERRFKVSYKCLDDLKSKLDP